MAFVDPYFDGSIGCLRNLLNAKSAAELQELEPQVVFANELELESINISRSNDLCEVLRIHEQLFKGVYDWAGQVRTVDIRKNDGDSEFFLPFSKILDAGNYIFTEFAKENRLQGLSREVFVKRLAHYYDQLNYIHPFREGNGRTQRIFWSRVARDARYAINWDAIMDGENDSASRLAAETMNLSGLEAMFAKIVAEYEHQN